VLFEFISLLIKRSYEKFHFRNLRAKKINLIKLKSIKFSVVLEGDKDIETYISILDKAEKYGFYSLQIYEHIPFKPSMLIISHLAHYLKKIKIGPVTIPFFLNDPLILARNIAFLQEITNNKIILGISRGAYSSYLCNKVDRRLSKFIDYLKCVESIFENKEFKGNYYEFKSSENLSWIKNKIPEIYVGTSGPKLCYEASKIKIVRGIVVDNLWNPEYASKMKAIINKAIQDSNRKDKVELVARPFVYLDDDYERAKRKMEIILKSYLPELVGKSPMLGSASKNGIDVERLACIGPLNKIEREIDSIVKAGVDHICFGHPLGDNIIAAIEKLGKELVSKFSYLSN